MPRDTGDKDKQPAGRSQRPCQVIDYYAETPAGGKNPVPGIQTGLPGNAKKVTPVDAQKKQGYAQTKDPVQGTKGVVKGGYADKFVQKTQGPPPSLPAPACPPSHKKDAQPPKDEIMQRMTETEKTNRASKPFSVPVSHPPPSASQKQTEAARCFKTQEPTTMKPSDSQPVEAGPFYNDGMVLLQTLTSRKNHGAYPSDTSSGSSETSTNNNIKLKVLEHPKTLDYSAENVKVNEDPDKVEEEPLRPPSRYHDQQDIHDYFPQEDVPSMDRWNLSSTNAQNVPEVPITRENRQSRRCSRSSEENFKYIDDWSSEFINRRRQEELAYQSRISDTNDNGNLKSIAEEEASKASNDGRNVEDKRQLQQAHMSRIVAENNQLEIRNLFDPSVPSTMTPSEKEQLDGLLRSCINEFLSDATMYARNDVNIIKKSSKNIVNWGARGFGLLVIIFIFAAGFKSASSFQNLDFDTPRTLPGPGTVLSRMYNFLFGK